MSLEQREQSEREQASRVLPPTPYPEPPAGRVEARREHFLTEIDQQTRSCSDRRAPRSRERWRLVVGAAMAAGAAVVVLTVDFGSSDPALNTPPASEASVELLEKAALAAATTPQTKVRTGQYSYVKTVGHTSALSETKAGEMQLLRESGAMEQWTSVDGSERTLQRKDGSDSLLPEAPGRGSLNAPTYDFLAALPTDPDALLEQIRDDARKNHGAGSGSTTGPDQEAFVTIGDLLRSGVTPPDTAASLYRAAALIPGVDVVPDVVDAAGRKGIAVARTHEGERTEWIFDKSTARLLGERTVLVEDNAWGEAGTVVTSVAITNSGIVDEAGRTP